MVLVPDHFAPNKDIKSAEQMMRDFNTNEITNYFELGMGIEHALLPERGLVLPGDVIIEPILILVPMGAWRICDGVGAQIWRLQWRQ